VTDDTYTVFVTSSCVVLLVWDLSRDDIFDVKSQIEALQAFASACPIVLVGSHSDLPQCTVEHTDRMFRKVLAALGPSHSANIHKCIRSAR
jgi:GTPase SAR1 family protein